MAKQVETLKIAVFRVKTICLIIFFSIILNAFIFCTEQEVHFQNKEHAESSCPVIIFPKELTGRETILSLIAGEWITKSIYTATELDVAGYLLQGPKNVRELAQLTQSNEESLYRLMRMLASVGVFQEGKNRIFANTSSSELLAKNHPQSLRSLILFYSEEMSQSWNRLTDCVKEGRPAFDLTFEQPVFSYFREHAESAVLFNAAMREKSKAVIASCLNAYNFGKFSSIYDIGGGLGHFLSALLTAYPNMKALLFELPEVIAAAKESIGQHKRCSLVSGDFFQNIPCNADAYLLKSILHDWTDKDALRILEKCSEAMSANAKLIIVEPIMMGSNQRDPAKFMDVYMMVITGGRERTEQEFETLLDRAGFTIDSITPTDTEFFLIEAHKK